MSRRRISEYQQRLNAYRDGPMLWPSSSDRREDQGKLLERGDKLLQEPDMDSFLHDFPDEADAIRAEVMRRLQSFTSGDASSLGEEQQLKTFRNTDAQAHVRRWTKRNRDRSFLAENYEESEIPLPDYDEQAKRLRQKDVKDTDSFETFKQTILRDWEAAREAKQRSLAAKRTKEQDSQVLNEMKTRIKQFRAWAELLGPIRRYLASAWDLSGSVQRESLFDLFERSERILDQREQVQAIADRLGRLDEAESEYEWQRLKSSSKPEELIIDRAGKSSVIGIRESDDIAATISSEVALLSSDDTEDLFFLKFAEKKLLTYDYQPEIRSRVTVRRGNIRQKTVVNRRGPIILAIDTSGSMLGELEKDAKALAVAIFRIAFQQHRSVHVISFSTATDSIVLTADKKGSLEKLIQFLLQSFHGGTDLAPPLKVGLAMLEKPEFRKADMMFLTDGAASVLGPDQVKAMEDAREKGVRFYSLLVGNRANNELLRQFDFNWQYQKSQLSEVAIRLKGFRRDRLIFNRS